MNRKNIRNQHITQFILWVSIILITSFVASFAYFRIDLTQEKRFTLSKISKEILKDLPGPVLIKVYLEGDIPIGFKKLNRAAQEMLDEFRIYAKNNIEYQFIDPYDNTDPKAIKAVLGELNNKGLQAVNAKIRDEKGNYAEKMVVPGVLVSYNSIEIPLSILSNNPGLTGEENLNNSLQDLEFQLIKTIKSLTFTKVEKIAFLEGHGELDQYETGDITRELANFYQVDRGSILNNVHAFDPYKCIIIAKPEKAFSEEDKFVIDQYIMNGGKVMWFIDAVTVNTDSLANGMSLASVAQLNIDDQLFRYGFRVNPVLLQDVQCALLPVNTAVSGNQPKFIPAPWQYFPLLSASDFHPVSRNLNMVKAEYCSFIDTLENINIKKFVLLSSSQFTKVKEAPNVITLKEIKQQFPKEAYNRAHLPVAVIAEGSFTSIFNNRPLSELKLIGNYTFKKQSVPNKMLIVADGDIIRNNVRETADGILIAPLGTDKYTSQVYGNKEFIVNAVEFINDEDQLMQLRTREIKLRVLNKTEIRDNKLFWQIVNVILPIVFVIFIGFTVFYLRKRKYSK